MERERTNRITTLPGADATILICLGEACLALNCSSAWLASGVGSRVGLEGRLERGAPSRDRGES